MTLEEVKKVLSDAGFEIKSECPIPHARQLRLVSGQIINVFSSGKVVVQGKHPEELEALLGDGSVSHAQTIKNDEANNRNVFVVYGHDEHAKTELEAMLRRWGLEPLIFDQLPSKGQTIIEKLESLRAQAHFAVVLATPDDEGHRANHSDEKLLRARQNVVLELGMMLAVLGRPKVAILLPSSVKMERPSDIQGLLYIPFKEKVTDAALALAKEINDQGIPIDLKNV